VRHFRQVHLVSIVNLYRLKNIESKYKGPSSAKRLNEEKECLSPSAFTGAKASAKLRRRVIKERGQDDHAMIGDDRLKPWYPCGDAFSAVIRVLIKFR